MALVETFYAAIADGEVIPSQDEWLDCRSDAEDSAKDSMQYNGSFDEMIGYEITIRPVFRAVPSVEIEDIR